ncbi:MAG: DUF4038 domain-containing protein [bacterium]
MMMPARPGRLLGLAFVLAVCLSGAGCGLERPLPQGSPAYAARPLSKPEGKENAGPTVGTAPAGRQERSSPDLPFVRVGPTKRYFQSEDGKPFFAIGHNEWPARLSINLESLQSIDAYLRNMQEHGENVLRVIADSEHVPVENPPGTFNPVFKANLDALVQAAERHGIYLQIAMWPNVFNLPTSGFWFGWAKHPYNKKKGGPVAEFEGLFRDPAAWKLQEGRIRFFVDNWGGRASVFAWEIANEFNYTNRDDWINHMSEYCRKYEDSKYGRAHLVCISTTASTVGTPQNAQWSSPHLDFATFHSYGKQDLPTGNRIGPVNPLQESLAIPKIVRRVSERAPGRPLLDCEMPGVVHGSRRLLLGRGAGDEAFTEMFLTSGLAYVCSGAAGSGFRWASNPVFQVDGAPNALSEKMYQYQLAIRRFTDQVDWNKMDPLPYDAIQLESPGKRDQANSISIVAKDRRRVVGMVLCALAAKDALQVEVRFSGLSSEPHRVRWFETRSGNEIKSETPEGASFALTTPSFVGHVAFVVEPKD